MNQNTKMIKLNTDATSMIVKKSARSVVKIAKLTEDEIAEIDRLINAIRNRQKVLNSSIFIESAKMDVFINDVLLYGKSDELDDDYTKKVLSEIYSEERTIPSKVDLDKLAISHTITMTDNPIRLYNYNRCYIGNPEYIIIFKT